MQFTENKKIRTIILISIIVGLLLIIGLIFLGPIQPKKYYETSPPFKISINQMYINNDSVNISSDSQYWNITLEIMHQSSGPIDWNNHIIFINRLGNDEYVQMKFEFINIENNYKGQISYYGDIIIFSKAFQHNNLTEEELFEVMIIKKDETVWKSPDPIKLEKL